MVEHRKGFDLAGLLNQVKRGQVHVGYFAHSHYPSGEPVAGVAAVHEMGSPTQRIPPRPTLGPGLNKNRAELSDAVKLSVQQAILSGGNLKLTNVGLLAQAAVRKEISELMSPPLSKRTIAERAKRHSKGLASGKPLVDTKVMLRSVDFKEVFE